MEKFIDVIDWFPLWSKLMISSLVVFYVWIQQQWTKLNNRGVSVLTPSILSFGTAGHYVKENGYPEFAKKELLDKDRKTIGLYRATSPVIVTVDIDLIQKITISHFHQFNSHNPAQGAIGAGPIFGYTLDILDDMPRWKRQL